MADNEKREKKYYTYILRCADDTFYTGYTTDVERRLAEHNRGLGARYTRGRLPVSLVYHEEYRSRSAAMKREYRIKKLSHREKKELIKGQG